MNLQSFLHNRKALGVTGAVAAAGAGLYVRRRRMNASASGASSANASPVVSGATLQPATYENIASDLYGALEPQLEQMQQSITGLQQRPPPNPPVPQPLSPLQKALISATPTQIQAFGNLGVWQQQHPGKDFSTEYQKAAAAGFFGPAIKATPR